MTGLPLNELLSLHEAYKTLAYNAEINATISSMPTTIDEPVDEYEYVWVDANTLEEVSPPWLTLGLLTESEVNSILIELKNGDYEGRILYSFPLIPLTPSATPEEPANEPITGGEGTNNAPTPTPTEPQSPQENSEPDNSNNPESAPSGNNNPPVNPINPPSVNPTTSNLGIGTSGNDNLTGNEGNNTLDGNAGDDAISGAGGEDRLFGNLGNDLISGGEESDLINGNQGNDTINGNQGNDTLHGGKSDDLLHGGKDNDLISGDLGNDQVFGDLGNDTLTGGDGKDTLTGGVGQDFFLFDGNTAFSTDTTGIDVLTDFTSPTDKIILDKTLFSALANVAVGVLSAENFTVVSSDTLAATGTELIVYNSTTGALYYNQNGAESGFGTGGQFATLLGTPVLTADDFLVQA